MARIGSRNSSITRVRPVFRHLLSMDPTGRDWLPKLWDLAANKRSQPDSVQRPADMGSLIAGEVTRTRPFADRILSHYERPVIHLAAAFERRLPPPDDFLRWLLQHPAALDKPLQGFRASGDNKRKREQLFSADRVASERAMAIGLAELDARGAAGSDKKWWAFEGFSEIDCYLVTPTTVLFIEGKRTERVSASTVW